MYSAFIWRCVILVEFCFFAEESSAFSLFLTRTFSHFLSLRIQTFGWFRYKINKGINPLMKSLKGLKILIKNLVTLKKEIWGEANAASNFIYQTYSCTSRPLPPCEISPLKQTLHIPPPHELEFQNMYMFLSSKKISP